MVRLLISMALGAACGAGLVLLLTGSNSDGAVVSGSPVVSGVTVESGGNRDRLSGPQSNAQRALTLGADARPEAPSPSLPDDQEFGAWIDGYADLAEQDLGVAIGAALAIEEHWAQIPVMRRIAAVAAETNPEAGIAMSAEFADFRLINQFRIAFFETWGEIDPESAFAWFAAAEPGLIPVLDKTFAGLAAHDPQRLIAVARNFPPNLKRTAQRSAFAALASKDPYSALDVLNSIGVGTSWANADRATHVQAIAQSIAYTDPSAALNLIHTLNAEDRADIIAGVANADVLAAAAYVMDELSGQTVDAFAAVSSLQQVMNRAFQSDSDTAAAIINMLASVDNVAATQALGGLVSRWAAFDAQRAVDWAMTNPASVSAASLQDLALRLGRSHANLAREAVARVPVSLRDTWIRNAAVGMGRNDFNGALALLEGIETREAREVAVEEMLRNTLGFGTRTSPGQAVAIVDYLSAAPADVRARHAAGAAGAYAAEDPRAAAEWIAGLDLAGTDEYLAAVQNVAALWSRSDTPAATNWALSLPTGDTRDRVLISFLGSVPLDARIDDRVFTSFASSSARDIAVSRLALGVGRFDTERANKLVTSYISDPEVRQRTTTRINQPQLPMLNAIARDQ